MDTVVALDVQNNEQRSKIAEVLRIDKAACASSYE